MIDSELDKHKAKLYPFQETVNSGANQDEIIEKIDIGGDRFNIERQLRISKMFFQM